MPLHRHEIEIDIQRVEFSISRVIDANWDAQFRLPWFSKKQVAEVEFIEQASAEEKSAARLNGEIHHRTETYEGFGDAEVTVGWRTYGLLHEKDTFRVSLGVSLPFGDTVEDPWLLGDAGNEHLHIEFGTGTFDPVADLYYGYALHDQWAASIYARAKVPLYENSDGHRGSVEAVVSPRLQYRPLPRLSFTAGLSANYLGRSEWEQTGIDRNSGAILGYASAGVGYIFGDSLTASLSAQFPIYTDLFGEEDGLEAAPIFGLSLSRQF